VLQSIEIHPAERPIDAVVRLPGSKSYTNRALVVAALADGECRIEAALFSDDTRYMIEALRALGFKIDAEPDTESIIVGGHGGQIPSARSSLFVGNAGTAARFLTAFVSLGRGSYEIDGVARMRERPIGPLLDALRQLGVEAVARNGNDCPPVVVTTTGLRGGKATIDGGVSSQFISALLMVAPCTSDGIELAIKGELVSQPYVDLTLSIMSAFGAIAQNHDYRLLTVPGRQRYQARTYVVEPDASAASYFLTAAAITGGRVRVDALGRRSAQGDLGLVGVLERMGCAVEWGDESVELRGADQLHGVDVDMGSMSDVAQSLAAIAPFATTPTRIRGVAHIRAKETDRVAAVTTELRRLGGRVEEHADGWTIYPSALHGASVETYDDHRMAMSFAVTGLRVAGVRILNPSCVAKTFPDFFTRFEALTSSP
jgi:3-phosphoshikimate 1-carboxyvinyltransferase